MLCGTEFIHYFSMVMIMIVESYITREGTRGQGIDSYGERRQTRVPFLEGQDPFSIFLQNPTK